MGARDVGRGARRHRRAHPQGARRGPAEGGHVPPRAGRATSWSICSASSTPGASTATTATPTSARPPRARATPSGTGSTGRRPITPTRASSCCSPRTSRPATTSTRTPSGSSRARWRGAKICVVDTRLTNTASMADYWLSPWPGTEAALLLAIAHVLLREGTLGPRVRPPLGQLGGVPARGAAGRCRSPSTRSSRRSTSSTRRTRPEFAESESGVPAARIEEVAREIGRAGSALATHVWRNAAAGNLGGWQVARALELVVVLVGAVGTPGGTAPSAWNKAVPAPPMMPPPGQDLERAPHAARVPARLLRDELPAAALPARKAAASSRCTSPASTTRCGPTRRHVVDRDADRRGEGGAARLPHADLERDRVVRRLRAADGARLRAPRPHEPGDARRALDRLPPAGAARGARAAGQDASTSPGRPTRRRGSGRCGRRTSSGSSCRGASIPTARSASASTSSRRTARARSCASRSSTAGSSSTACPACPRPPQREGLTPLEYMRKYGAFLVEDNVYRTHETPLAAAEREGAAVDPVTRVVIKGGQRGRRRDRRAVARGLPDAVAQARVLLEDAQGLEVAGARGADLRAQPRALVARSTAAARRDGCSCPPSGCRP